MNIQKALEDLREVTQRVDETEDDYFTRFEKARACEGSPCDDREGIARFIEATDRRIGPLIHRYREVHVQADIVDVLETAKHHGEAVRTQLGSSRKMEKSSVRIKQRKSAHKHMLKKSVAQALKIASMSTIRIRPKRFPSNKNVLHRHFHTIIQDVFPVLHGERRRKLLFVTNAILWV